MPGGALTRTMPGRLHWLSDALLGGPVATGARDQARIQFGCGQRLPTSWVLERSSRAPVSTAKTKVCRFAEIVPHQGWKQKVREPLLQLLYRPQPPFLAMRRRGV